MELRPGWLGSAWTELGNCTSVPTPWISITRLLNIAVTAADPPPVMPGEAVGVAPGSLVGVTLGDELGIALGDALGDALGVTLGDELGKAIGLALGTGVDVAVGNRISESRADPIYVTVPLGEAIGYMKFDPGAAVPGAPAPDALDVLVKLPVTVRGTAMLPVYGSASTGSMIPSLLVSALKSAHWLPV